MGATELWKQADGASCRLVEMDAAPKFELVLVKSGDVVRRCRLYAEAAARMLADEWKASYPAISCGAPEN